MTSFDEQDVPNVAVVLLDGPLDGQRYKIPRVPPEMTVPTSLTVPLKQPASASPFAVYRREGEEPVGGYFVFFFDDCWGPNGERILYAPDAETLAPASVTDVVSEPISA